MDHVELLSESIIKVEEMKSELDDKEESLWNSMDLSEHSSMECSFPVKLEIRSAQEEEEEEPVALFLLPGEETPDEQEVHEGVTRVMDPHVDISSATLEQEEGSRFLEGVQSDAAIALVASAECICSRFRGRERQVQQHATAKAPACPAGAACKMYSGKLAALGYDERSQSSDHTFECSICKKNVSNRRNLLNHMLTHTGERPFECSVCEKTFTARHTLSGHMRTHTGERPFECSVCKHVFLKKEHLNKHARIHSSIRPFECCVCKRGFSSRDKLNRHLRTHTGERPFECPICKQRFGERAHLVRHARKHTGIRPFGCFTCKKDFVYKEHLIRHIRTHAGEKPYECSVCVKAFTTKYYLNKHAQTHSDERAFDRFASGASRAGIVS